MWELKPSKTSVERVGDRVEQDKKAPRNVRGIFIFPIRYTLFAGRVGPKNLFVTLFFHPRIGHTLLVKLIDMTWR